MIRNSSGDWVHVRQAVLDARKARKEIPITWKVVLRDFHASRRRLRKTARSLGETPARLAFGKTRRTIRPTNRSQGGAWKSDGLSCTRKGHRTKPKMRGPFNEALGVRQDRRGLNGPNQMAVARTRTTGNQD